MKVWWRNILDSVSKNTALRRAFVDEVILFISNFDKMLVSHTLLQYTAYWRIDYKIFPELNIYLHIYYGKPKRQILIVKSRTRKIVKNLCLPISYFKYTRTLLLRPFYQTVNDSAKHGLKNLRTLCKLELRMEKFFFHRESLKRARRNQKTFSSSFVEIKRLYTP